MKTIFWTISIIDFLILILCLRLWQENKRIRKEILENEGGIIEHKSDIEEEARLYRQKIARRELIPAFTIKNYLDTKIRFWRKERENLLMAEHYIDAYQSVRISLLGELLENENIEKEQN